MRPSPPAPLRPAAAAVDAARLIAADTEPGQWMSTAAPTTSSASARSTQIDASNVGELGLAWYADFDTSRGAGSDAARRRRRAVRHDRVEQGQRVRRATGEAALELRPEGAAANGAAAPAATSSTAASPRGTARSTSARSTAG